MSLEDYQQLTMSKVNIVDFFRKSPLKDAELDLIKDNDIGWIPA